MAAFNKTSLLRLTRASRLLQAKPSVTPARFIYTPTARAVPQEKKTSSSPIASRAAFHASSKREILPPLPERINGGPNEPVPIIPPNAAHGSYHWAFERLISVALVPITIAPFAAGSLNPLMDGLFCGLILIHSHIGFQSVIIDYLPSWRVPFLRKLFWWGLNLATVAVGVGLYEFETHDIGITETIKKAWTA